MKYSNELKVGVTILLAIVILIFGVRYLEDLPIFGGTYELYTQFNDAGGLLPGSMVRISGVSVGSVDAVALDPETKNVVIEFHVDEGIPIPEGSYTELSGIRALGEVSLEVVPGPASNPPIARGEFIPSRSESMFSNLTSRAPQLISRVDTLLFSLNQTLQGLDPAVTQADVALEQIGGTVDRLGGQASQTLSEVNRLVASSSTDLQQTLAGLRETTEALQEVIVSERGRISEILVDVEGITGNLGAFSDENSDSLTAAVQNLNTALRRLDRNLIALEGVSTGLDTALVKLNRGDGTLGLLLNDPALYRTTVDAMENLNNLMIDLQENPRRYLGELQLVDIF